MQEEIPKSQNMALRLRDYRRKRDQTQAEFAALGGVSLGAQHRYEAGATEPNASYFANLHAAGIDILYLITGTPGADSLDAECAALLMCFLQLPARVRTAMLTSVRAVQEAVVD